MLTRIHTDWVDPLSTVFPSLYAYFGPGSIAPAMIFSLTLILAVAAFFKVLDVIELPVNREQPEPIDEPGYVEHKFWEIDGFRVVDATIGPRTHDDLVWVGYGGTEGRWLPPAIAIDLAAAITKAAKGNLARRGQPVPTA